MTSVPEAIKGATSGSGLCLGKQLGSESEWPEAAGHTHREWSYSEVASRVEGEISRECCAVCFSLATFPGSLLLSTFSTQFGSMYILCVIFPRRRIIIHNLLGT